jgi:hypothetical protein
MQKGFMLVLTMIFILILSIIAGGLFSIGKTEISTTQNHLLNKTAFYHALLGMENVVGQIQESSDPTQIKVSDPPVLEAGTYKKYITGTLSHLQKNEPQNISLFRGFTPPPLAGVSLGVTSGMVPLVWKVPITSEIQRGRKKSYAEVESGVYYIAKEY